MMLHYSMYALLLVLSAIAASNIPFDSRLDEHWDIFKKTYNKQYQGHEEYARRLIWEGKVTKVIHHNLRANMGLHSYTKGINEYSDLSQSNFVRKLNGLKRSDPRSGNGSTWLEPSNVQIPDKVDWRDQGFVTPVKNQRHCGTCWAFSATGALEGQHKRKSGQLVSLSEQNVIDCSQPYGNYGCNGGLVESVYKYVEGNNGIDTEHSYPITGVTGDKCLFCKSDVGATCTGYVEIPSGDEDALMKAVATIGPISVAIDASNENFHLYSGGIYDEPTCSDKDLGHAVLVVGYGTEAGTDYWLVKNSWGTSWGERGYAKMSRNKGNHCGIATEATYPLV